MARNSKLVIANAASVSGTLDLGDGDLILGLQIPSAWTAADITFGLDVDGTGTFQPVFDEAGGELKVASANVVASRFIILNATGFARVAGKIILRSGTSAVPVNQGAARTIGVLLGKRYI